LVGIQQWRDWAAGRSHQPSCTSRHYSKLADKIFNLKTGEASTNLGAEYAIISSFLAKLLSYKPHHITTAVDID
jgi:hypothetical protein